MTDPLRALDDLLSNELEAEKTRWAKGVTKVESQAAAKGAFQSGARLVMTAECLSAGLVHYRQFIFDKWTTYIRPRLWSLSSAEQTAFCDVALRALDVAIVEALAQFQKRPKPQHGPDVSGPIKETGASERRSLEAELRLYMTTPVDRPAGVSVITHGSNSPVNVGSGSVNQQINTTEGMAELVNALTALLDAMKQVQDPAILNDVREIVVEAKDEAAKPVPNKLRLRSILGGAKDALQGVAAAQPAWETVQRVMQMLGLAS